MFFSSQKLFDVNIEKFDIFGIVESWTSVTHTSIFQVLNLYMNPGLKKRETEEDGGFILYFKKRLAENKIVTKVHSTKFSYGLN